MGLSRTKPVLIPRNEPQRQYVEWLSDPTVSMCVGVGPAGTGKTLFAGLAAIQSFERGEIDKIIVTRPTISVANENIGFLPGSMQQKMDPWIVPLMDALLEKWSKTELDTMLRTGRLEVVPFGFMRGRTFKRTFVLADEVQNTTPTQLLMLATRIGDGSKLVMTGDVHQSDYGPGNGLEDFLQRFRRHAPVNGSLEQIRLVTFSTENVERSPVVKTILKMYGGNV